jgi:hypothetical protein
MSKLQRKLLRRKMRPQAELATIKRLTAKPVIKKVDVEELKKQFGNKPA